VGQIVNLNKVRKQKSRVEKKARASRNRITHGQSKANKQIAEKSVRRDQRELDGKALKNTPSKDD